VIPERIIFAGRGMTVFALRVVAVFAFHKQIGCHLTNWQLTKCISYKNVTLSDFPESCLRKQVILLIPKRRDNFFFPQVVISSALPDTLRRSRSSWFNSVLPGKCQNRSYLKLHGDRFLSYPFQFVVDNPSQHSTLQTGLPTILLTLIVAQQFSKLSPGC
jgi:hypothetical protein